LLHELLVIVALEFEGDVVPIMSTRPLHTGFVRVGVALLEGPSGDSKDRITKRKSQFHAPFRGHSFQKLELDFFNFSRGV